MLKLKKINKSYKTGNFVQNALKNVSIDFSKNEFVSVLGPSGSGKTTLLNIIGGLDHYDSGDLILNNKSTKKFKSKDWDAYRNNCIGFIFQNYNLIGHISILANVEMGMTLSGVSAKKRRKKALEVLKMVGLEKHVHKKPNQLSGGQMQRVAIARALANDPDIILADEPTGALDSKTSIQIMELIKKISKNKLVIMVTHNPELAKTYASRIIEMKDGEVVKDSLKKKDDKKSDKVYKLKKTSMSFFTALKLSLTNIKTKKGRTILTAFASSIGIIGIALILALSNGFQIEVDDFERESLSNMPITITEQSIQMDEETMEKIQNNQNKLTKYPKKKTVLSEDDISNTMLHNNEITEDYVDYIKNLDSSLISGMSMQKSVGFNVINHSENGEYKLIENNNPIGPMWTVLPSTANKETSEVITSNFDVLAGSIDDNEVGLILQVDNKNGVSKSVLEQLGFKDTDEVSFKQIMNKELKVVSNDDYYKAYGNRFIPSNDYEKMYNSKNSITLKVKAIIRGKKDKELITNSSGIIYTSALTDLVIEKNKDSKIVEAQNKSDVNVLTNQKFDETKNSTNTKKLALAYLGAESTPTAIYIYPKDFDKKDQVIEYLDKYNDKKAENEKVLYTDMAEMISSLSGNIMSAITVVLIAFSSISLIVSSIMIGIITYISVLERTKEIGILRALGARKKDITRVFNAETFIIGLFSGLLGILIALILTIPANSIIESLSGLADVAKLNPLHALILIVISMILTLIGGIIPAKIASKKDPVEALRTE